MNVDSRVLPHNLHWTSMRAFAVLVRREAVTALGMLGQAAETALPRFESLGKDADVQTRVRAVAAMRAIKRAK